MTARTNASELKLEQMLYYKNTKLRSRRRSREGHVYIYSAKIPLTRAPVSVVYNSAMISYRGGTPAPSHKRPFLANQQAIILYYYIGKRTLLIGLNKTVSLSFFYGLILLLE